MTRSVYNVVDGKKVWIRQVTHVLQERYSDGSFNFGAIYEDGSLNAVIDSLIAIRESIPEPYRENARCEIDSESGYEGSHHATIEVRYSRPETPAETAEREAEANRLAEQERIKELRTLAALQAKYG